MLAHDPQVTDPGPRSTSRIVFPCHVSAFGPQSGSPSGRSSWIVNDVGVVGVAASLICPVSLAGYGGHVIDGASLKTPTRPSIP